MAWSRVDRKVAILKLGLNNRKIAEACGVDEFIVCHVIAGRRLTGWKGQRVVAYLARKIGLPRAEVFPGYVCRKGRPPQGRAA